MPDTYKSQEDPLFSGLFDPTITSIPEGVSQPNPDPVPQAANMGVWKEEPRMPIATAEMGVVACNGKVHVIGGYARGKANSDYHQVFDPATGEWTLKAPIPYACNHLCMTVIGSKIYSFGGFIEQNRCPHSNCFVYDADADEWERIPNLLRPRGAISSVVLDGKIHLLGGRNVRSVDWHEIYDPVTRTYEFLNEMRGSTPTQPFAGQRCHMGAVVADGKIHCIGGRKDSYDFNTGLHSVFDPEMRTWSFRGGMPTIRSGHCAAYVDGKILAFGGEARGLVFEANEAYDPATDSWEVVAPMPVPRHGLHGQTAAVIGNKVYVPGGAPITGGSVQGAYHDSFTFG
ncbi:Kelch repeat-containing protein [Parasedimentitalea psychrophila]|uniref:Kelch repeat-containing protein n=1 Tax=Parasedimentitalea psychrophila TaxID=2997337 RepID=A0A9Y2L451_9RHOB|nr:kelch repeat-containing protein [Parasedimentitalea psychrophila]WIY26569.1 kelch repeat-containing protein [Parasedimentitalea psychrophila]